MGDARTKTSAATMGDKAAGGLRQFEGVQVERHSWTSSKITPYHRSVLCRPASELPGCTFRIVRWWGDSFAFTPSALVIAETMPNPARKTTTSKWLMCFTASSMRKFGDAVMGWTPPRCGWSLRHYDYAPGEWRQHRNRPTGLYRVSAGYPTRERSSRTEACQTGIALLPSFGPLIDLIRSGAAVA